MLGLKQHTLNITFHNPNTVEELVKELIVFSAEVAKAKVSDTLIQIDQNSIKLEAEQE